MKEMADHDSGVQAKDFNVIPNPIDDKLFKFMPKQDDQKFRVLMVRSFNGMKYAPDVSAKVIRRLLKDKRFEVTVVGDGYLRDKYMHGFAGNERLFVHRGFIERADFARLCQSHGYFLCPTRMDAQGVAMCEAMMAGCIPVTCDIESVREFCWNNFVNVFDIESLPDRLATSDFMAGSVFARKRVYGLRNEKVIKCELNYIFEEERK
jgi:glycosyltransferase involved in cell wall biosynthesis